MRHFLRMTCCVLLLACGGTEPAPPLPDDTFVAVMAGLRRAHMQEPDEAAYAARREQLLSEHGVTAEQLREFVAFRSRDLSHMARLWERINAAVAETEQ